MTLRRQAPRLISRGLSIATGLTLFCAPAWAYTQAQRETDSTRPVASAPALAANSGQFVQPSGAAADGASAEDSVVPTRALRPRPSTQFPTRIRDVSRVSVIEMPVPMARSTSIPQLRSTAPSPWYAPLASLALPGSGQATLRQQRSVAYLVAEGFLVLRAVRAQNDRNSAKLQYQKLAADVARAGFGTERPNGSWDYYEILEHYPASGAFDLNVAGKFTPETDESTYNGELWFRARQIFWDNPDQAPDEASTQYIRALDRYKSLAMQGSFRFSWKDQSNVQNEYILSIADANRSRQQVVSTLGLLAANHLASAVDAYINVRLRRFGGAGLLGASVKTEVRPTGPAVDKMFGAAMTLSVPVSIGIGNR